MDIGTILYQKGIYTVRQAAKGWVEVYKDEGTAARRCASFGPGFLKRAIAVVDEKHGQVQA